MTNTRQPSRSVARDAREDEPTSAEQIRALLDELHHGVETHDTVLRYRPFNRGRRTVSVPEFTIHRTKRPGLLTQLGTVQATAGTVPVDVFRWQRDKNDPCERDDGDDRVCPHGRWAYARTERRTIPGVITTGAAVPGGSPGWDADGALSPMTVGGKPDAAEPIAEAWHTAEQIRDELGQLGRELHDEGWRPPDTLVTIALADEDTAHRIAVRLRSLVSRARIAAGYDAPKVALRDVYCPRCSGPMMVRADASSAVWCEGWLPLQGAAIDAEAQWPIGFERCRSRWPRGHWVRLLEEATADTDAVADLETALTG